MGTRLFKMLGRSKFALRQGFRLRQKRLYAPSGAAPSSSQSPLCSVSACGKNFAALPCSSSPQTTHCVGLVWGSPRWGPEELGDRKKQSRPTGGFAAKFGNLLQVEESVHTGILSDVAQPPIVCQRTQWGPDYLKCSGEVNSPCAKVFACGKNACTRLPAPPLRRHKVRSAPFLPAAKTSLRSLAPPPPRRPTALGSSGAHQDGAPRSWATGKSKAARRAALLQNSETYFRLKKAFIPGY